MNRITLHNFDYGYFVMEGDCQLETVKSTAEGCNLDLFSGNAVDCLAAYEDTGLTPDEISALRAELGTMGAERDRYRRMALDMMVDLFKPTFVNRDGTERPTALAVDFDGTLCEQAWPGFGNPNMWLIERLVSFREQGGELILWTNREGEPLQAAVDFCAGYGLRFDAVNANLPRWMEFFKNDTRKPGADYYIDDKAVCIKAEWRGPDGQGEGKQDGKD